MVNAKMLGQNISSILLTGWASLQSHASDWILDKTVGWPKQPPVNKIDLHHHFVPDFFAQGLQDRNPKIPELPANVITAIEANGDSPDGFLTPRWSPVASRLLMKHLGVQTAILSAPDPGPCITADPDEQASLARRLNTCAASLRDEDPLTFGFFASLPDIRNSSAAIAELRYALDFLRADGVVLYTRYGPGNVYLGNEFLDPVWSELDAHNATVFVHPTHPADAVAEPWNPRLPTRMIDYPHEITRAALDMVAAKTLTRFPNVKVVLSHAGGNLPWLMGRLTASLRRLPKVAASLGQSQTGLTLQEAEDALGGFWYDIAASTAPYVLRTLLEVVPEDKIVYGSDYPYLPSPAQPSFLEDLEKSEMTIETRDKINFRNAQALISRFAKQVGLPSIPEDEPEDCPVPEQEL